MDGEYCVHGRGDPRGDKGKLDLAAQVEAYGEEPDDPGDCIWLREV